MDQSARAVPGEGARSATLTARKRSGVSQSRAARKGRAQASRAAVSLDGDAPRSYPTGEGARLHAASSSARSWPLASAS